MIELNNVVKNYRNHKVLKEINLHVKSGEIYGFIGHNGAGKSTTMNILAGLIGFNSGVCRINGNEVKRVSNIKEVGYLPEDPQFYPYMNAKEYLNFIGTMVGDKSNDTKKKTKNLLELVKLTEASNRAIGGYSRGMKQRLGIAVSMYQNPRVLLLDEPSSALDPEGRLDVVDIILNLKKQGKTIFLSTHILNDIERICDRVGILHNGQLILEEELDTLLNKYTQPIYDIDFIRELTQEQIKGIQMSGFVEKIETKNYRLSIWINDFNTNSNNILNLITKTNIPITNINMRKSSLEEIFLKVVK